MNWKLFGAMAALIGVGASVALGQGTSTTIVEASYISNVFGQSNFIKNPNAKLNTSNVTVSSATVLRSISSPLVATSEFTITTSTATGFADWATRTFDQGMKGQNCEARFTYKGFTVGSTTAQIRQGSNTIAQLTLTPSATDPRIASINFPCGDLSAATTFRLQQATAALTGTNEIGGIYVGLATNQANVAQAETVVVANVNALITVPTATYTNVVYQSESLDTYGEYNNSTGVFTAKRAGNYFIAASMFWLNSTWNATNIYLNVFKNGSLVVENLRQIPSGATYYVQESSVSISLSVGDTLYVSAYHSDSANRFIASNSSFSRLSISRFPTSSELVVTPERQNVWGGVRYYGSPSGLNVRGGSAASTTYSTYNSATWTANRTLQGKCAAPTSSGDDVGCSIPNMPVGSYKIDAKGLMYNVPGTAGSQVTCSYEVYETTTTTSVHNGTINRYDTSGGVVYQTGTIGGVFNNTSIATRNFVIRAAKTADIATGNTSTCNIFYSNSGSELSAFQITVEPLDQPSNSALYVQGPVQAAATGAAIAAGYQGENILVNPSGTVTPGASIQDCNKTVASYTLQPGVYLVSGTVALSKGTISGYLGAYACISTSANATDTAAKNNVAWHPAGSSTSSPYIPVGPRYLNITTATTIYLTAGIEYTTLGTAVYSANSSLQIVRLN